VSWQLLVVLALSLVCLVLPLSYTVSLWRTHRKSRLGWAMKLLTAGAVVLLVLLVGRWDMLGYYTRFLIVGLFALAAFVSWQRHRGPPLTVPGDRPYWRRHGIDAFVLGIFIVMLARIAMGFLSSREAVALAFPLRDGWFMVGQGGDSTLINYHNSHPTQRYALDISALNPFGFRASGILPTDLDRYEIFGKPVVSPCDGAVRAARDGLEDLKPPRQDRQNVAGNHVVITCGAVDVELAHLRNGSVAVAAGDPVSSGQVIGAVGNSGNTTEPHLHVHAVRRDSGEAVPMMFDGRFLVRNAAAAS
jgi:Peptidase family M23